MIRMRNLRWFRRLVWFGFAATAFATLLSLLATRHWFFELFTHFRPYYLLPQVALVLVLFSWRQRSAMLLTLALAASNLWFVGPYIAPLLVQESAAVVAGATTTVVVLNLNYRNDEHARVLDYVRRRSPDIVLFSELTGEWEAALTSLESEYPHKTTYAREGPWGMGMYSRLPLVSIEALELGAPDTVNIRAELNVGGQKIDLYSVHLLAPVNPDWATTRINQFDALKESIARNKTPGHITVVAGDFNVTPFSPYFTDLLDSAGLDDAARRYGLRETWPTYAFPFGIPIDHCLVTAGEAVARVDLGPDVGSDHLPLEIELGPVLASY